MSQPVIKVEIGFDLTDSPASPFFQLDDSVKGRLDNTEYRLGGTLFYDVTDRAVAVNISRGKDALTYGYPAGEANVEFRNEDRAFDPLYADSPFAGNIIPRRELRISANDVEIYHGWIDDWDLVYAKDGTSIAIAKALDAIYLLNNQVVFPFTPIEQTSGERINAILDKEEIGWPSTLRDIDSGGITVGAYAVEQDINAYQYIQSIASSDPGDVFITRNGDLAFRDRRNAPNSNTLVAFGEGGIGIDEIRVVYGSEQLFNQVTMTRQTGGTVVAVDPLSVDQYGVRAWEISDSQVSTDEQLAEIAVTLAAQYSQPAYRFDAIDIYLHKANISDEDKDKILALDLGDICSVTFTPNNVGDSIVRYVEIISVNQQVEVDNHVVTFGFKEIRYAPLVLDDVVFGKLDVGTLSW